MARIAVPLIDAGHPSDVLIPVDSLRRAGLDVDLVGVDRQPVDGAGVALTPTATITDGQRYDAIVIPSLGFDPAVALPAGLRYADWLRAHHRAGGPLTSWCTGAFVLAAAGLADGRRVTTHWAAAAELRAGFPGIDVAEDQMLVVDGSIITAGGATAVYLLIAHLVERFRGRAASVRFARDCVIDLRRPSQLAYSDLRSVPASTDPMVAAAQRHVAANLASDRLGLDSLAHAARTSPRTLARRFRDHLDMSPVAYVQNARVEAAKEALVTSDADVAAITTSVGYSDPRTFRRLFRRHTGLSPHAYRQLFRGHEPAAAPGRRSRDDAG